MDRVNEAALAAANLMLTAGLLKAVILLGPVWAVARAVCARSVEVRAALWTSASLGLLLLPVVGWRVAALDVEVVAVPRRLFQGAGPASPALWLAWVWTAGAAGMMGSFVLGWTRVRRVVRRAETVRDARLLALLA